MNNPFDHIEKFLAGELSATHTQAFEEALKSDASLREEVEMVKEMELFAQRKADSQGAIDVVRQVMEDGEKIEEGKMRRLSFIRATAAVVLVCLAAIGSWVYFSDGAEELGHEELFAVYFEPESASFAVKSTDTDSSLIKAENAFNAKQYQEAINNFELVEDEAKAKSDVNYFRALSELALDKLVQSRNRLDHLPIEYKNDVIWYKALIDIKSEKYNSAIELLNKIPENSAYKKRSEELISTLSEQQN